MSDVKKNKKMFEGEELVENLSLVVEHLNECLNASKPAYLSDLCELMNCSVNIAKDMYIDAISDNRMGGLVKLISDCSTINGKVDAVKRTIKGASIADKTIEYYHVVNEVPEHLRYQKDERCPLVYKEGWLCMKIVKDEADAVVTDNAA